jgi:acyl-CoA thioester hydrolase
MAAGPDAQPVSMKPPQLEATQRAQPASFHWPVRVYWEDTDAGGIVFYANYLKFFERARTEWLRSLGVEQQALRGRHGGFFVVAETNVRYLQSARLDDQLHVSADITQAGRASLSLHQQAWLVSSDPPRLLCEGDIRIGWVEATSLRPNRMPAELWGTLQAALPSTSKHQPHNVNATP